MPDKKTGKTQPRRSEKGQAQEDARRQRLAEQLRANLGKRKQQQRSRSGNTASAAKVDDDET